jgi:NADPH-dependent glutamate synthase beta subunit-like oxidoreductase
VPVEERCCPELGRCEVQKVATYIGISPDTKKWTPTSYPRFIEEPLLERDYNLCIGCTRCVRACNDLRGIGALTTREIEPGVTIAWAKNETLAESGCKFCGTCIEVCPTGALLDKKLRPGRREDVLVPCTAACPAGIDIPRYVDLIANGRAELAARVIRQKVPFPAVLGHACFHPCEDVCRRGELDEPIAICALKRFAAESDPGAAVPKVESKREKVAVIGAGPAGLTAAFYLASAGYPTVVYEAMPEPGGMMRYGAPPYRLPREIIDQDIRHITALPNLELKCNTVSSSPKALMANGHDAVVVACGTWKSKTLAIEGVSLDRLVLGGDFLRDRTLGKFRRDRLLDRKLVVIGGGNVAIDCARTALRLGAQSVDIACLESRNFMPAHEQEIADVEAEGARIHDGWGPKLFVGDGEKVTGVALRACTRVFSDAGHFSPEFDDSATKRLEADFVILAVGLEGNLEFCRDDDDLRVTKWASIEADREGLTSEPGVFAAGDIVTGPSSIIEAIAAGRRAATSALKHLGENGGLLTDIPELSEPDRAFGEDPEFTKRNREWMPKLDPQKRIEDFDPVELGYDADAARREAGRCLRCDMRLRLSKNILPPEPWLALNEENVAPLSECEGVYQLLDAEKKVIAIKGTPSVKADLLEKLAEPGDAEFFMWESAPMYTQRESELIQQYLQTHGELPSGGDDDLDDLF